MGTAECTGYAPTSWLNKCASHRELPCPCQDSGRREMWNVGMITISTCARFGVIKTLFQIVINCPVFPESYKGQ